MELSAWKMIYKTIWKTLFLNSMLPFPDWCYYNIPKYKYEGHLKKMSYRIWVVKPVIGCGCMLGVWSFCWMKTAQSPLPPLLRRSFCAISLGQSRGIAPLFWDWTGRRSLSCVVGLGSQRPDCHQQLVMQSLHFLIPGAGWRSAIAHMVPDFPNLLAPLNPPYTGSAQRCISCTCIYIEVNSLKRLAE